MACGCTRRARLQPSGPQKRTRKAEDSRWASQLITSTTTATASTTPRDQPLAGDDERRHDDDARTTDDRGGDHCAGPAARTGPPATANGDRTRPGSEPSTTRPAIRATTNGSTARVGSAVSVGPDLLRDGVRHQRDHRREQHDAVQEAAGAQGGVREPEQHRRHPDQGHPPRGRVEHQRQREHRGRRARARRSRRCCRCGRRRSGRGRPSTAAARRRAACGSAAWRRADRAWDCPGRSRRPRAR